jgi:excisionase family DNA binding protein
MTAQTHATQLPPLLVRTEEAARLMSVSKSTVERLMRTGELASVKAAGARRIPVSAIEDWIERQLKEQNDAKEARSWGRPSLLR